MLNQQQSHNLSLQLSHPIRQRLSHPLSHKLSRPINRGASQRHNHRLRLIRSKQQSQLSNQELNRKLSQQLSSLPRQVLSLNRNKQPSSQANQQLNLRARRKPHLEGSHQLNHVGTHLLGLMESHERRDRVHRRVGHTQGSHAGTNVDSPQPNRKVRLQHNHKRRLLLKQTGHKLLRHQTSKQLNLTLRLKIPISDHQISTTSLSSAMNHIKIQERWLEKIRGS